MVRNLAIVALTATVTLGAVALYPLARDAWAKQPPALAKDPSTTPSIEKTVAVLEPISDKDRESASALVAKISQGKASVSEVFRGPGGFTGVVVLTGEGKFIGWMPMTRDALFVGAMFDQAGKNITQAEMLSRGYASNETPPTAQAAGAQPPQAALQRAIDATAGFTEGKSGPVVTAFVDYNCTYCRDFYQRSRALIAQGHIRVRWVPVAIIDDTSLPKAAAILGNSDPTNAMAMVEEGRLGLPATISQGMKEKVGANNAVLNALSNGNSATPTLVIRKADGTLGISPGLPQDLGAFVAASR